MSKRVLKPNWPAPSLIRRAGGLCLLLYLMPVCALAQDALYEVSAGKYLMGTRVEATIHHTDILASQQAVLAAFLEMERIEQVLSAHIPESEVSEINDAAGIVPVRVSRETFEIVSRARGYSEQSGGLFDATVGPLSRLWGFSDDRGIEVLDSSIVVDLLRLVDYRAVQLSQADTSVFLPRKGMALDLGGIAKGYAVDRAAAVLRERGIDHFLLNAGGDIYAAGLKDGQHPWRVGIKHPGRPQDLIAAFGLSDGAVATSGDYERFVDIEGVRYHHILDPRTGRPGRLSRSASALAATAEEADVLATLHFLLGAANLDTDRPPASLFLIVDSLGEVHVSSDFEKKNNLEIWN